MSRGGSGRPAIVRYTMWPPAAEGPLRPAACRCKKVNRCPGGPRERGRLKDSSVIITHQTCPSAESPPAHAPAESETPLEDASMAVAALTARLSSLVLAALHYPNRWFVRPYCSPGGGAREGSHHSTTQLTEVQLSALRETGDGADSTHSRNFKFPHRNSGGPANV